VIKGKEEDRKEQVIKDIIRPNFGLRKIKTKIRTSKQGGEGRMEEERVKTNQVKSHTVSTNGKNDNVKGEEKE